MRSRRLALLAVVALALAVHGNAVLDGFAFDDGWYVTRNAAVQSSDLRRLATESYWAGAGSPAPYWRPAAMASFGLQHAVAGLAPWSYHLVSVLLHAAVAALLFLLAVRYTGSVAASLAAAAAFAVHPAGVEAVSSVGHRPDLMAALFALAALLLHAGAPGKVRTAGAAAALLLACASKETGVAALAPMLAHDLAVRCGGRLAELRRAWRGPLGAAWLAYAAVAGGYLAARHAVVGGFAPARISFLANPLAAQPLWTQKVLALSVLGRSLRLVLWPARLSADYGPSVLALDPARAAPDALLGLAALAGLGWLAVRAARTRPAIAVGLALAGAAWLPGSNLLFPVEVGMAERLLYLPLAGLALAAAGAVASMPVRALAPVAAAAVLALGARAVVRTYDWRDDATLYAAAVATYPQSARAHFALAQAHRRADAWAESLAEYDRAVAIWPGFTWALCERADLLHHFGRAEEALASARRALELEPGEPRLRRCYADALRRAGR